jgi:hypothetical protein
MVYCFGKCESFDSSCHTCKEIEDIFLCKMENLSSENRLEYLKSFSEFNHYVKYGDIRTEWMKKRLEDYSFLMQDSTMKNALKCSAAFIGPELEEILCT